MSGINSASEKLKQKMEKKKIDKSTLGNVHLNVDTAKPQLIKHTVYLTPEISQKLNNFYARRMLKGIKENRYDIICKAIENFIDSEHD